MGVYRRRRLASLTVLPSFRRSSMSIEPTDKAYAGQAIYNPATLALYDIVVLGISNRLIWRCPTRHILQLYNQHATDNHLDVGVGTGWYLDHCRFSGPRVRLGLLDLNQSSLNAAVARLRRYRPEVYRADALRPFRFETAPFASVSLTYLLHCLPGTMSEKARLFDHLGPVLSPRCCRKVCPAPERPVRLCGSTIIRASSRTRRIASTRCNRN